MKQTARATLIALFLLSLTLGMAHPAAAQVVPPTRNASSFSYATFSSTPVYSFGLALTINPTLDATFAYSTQTAGGSTGSLLGLGARYHFKPTAPGVDAFVGGGLASATATLPGFGTLNASGLFVGGGASLHFADRLIGYAAGSLYSLGGTSNSVIDLGVQIQLAPRVSGQIGYINFAGSGAPYLGISVNLP